MRDLNRQKVAFPTLDIPIREPFERVRGYYAATPTKLRLCRSSEVGKTDPKGFVKTGQLVSASPYWMADRAPFFLETSHSGVFAAGDVRLGSTKRVASGVGKGAMAVQFIHEYLRLMGMKAA